MTSGRDSDSGQEQWTATAISDTPTRDPTSLVIGGSVLVHGLTAAPFTRWYARVAGHADP